MLPVTHRLPGLNARSFTARSIPALALVSLFGLAPLAASTAATPESASTATAMIEPATAAAVIELVPLPSGADTTSSEPVPAFFAAEPAPSAPQETALGRGSASYYAAKFHGRRTASGERFDNADMTAAHRSLPFGTLVRVSNPANGRSVVVRINDRGPFTRGRLIDVSRAAAEHLGMIARGHAMVELAQIAD